MPDNYNNDIYRDIKSKLESYSVEYNPSAWTEMSEMLDKEMPVKRRRYLLFIIIAAIIALFISAYFIFNSVTDNSSRCNVKTESNNIQQVYDIIPDSKTDEVYSQVSSKINNNIEINDKRNNEIVAAISGYSEPESVNNEVVENEYYQPDISGSGNSIDNNSEEEIYISDALIDVKDSELVQTTDTNPNGESSLYNGKVDSETDEVKFSVDKATEEAEAIDSLSIPDENIKSKRRRKRWFSGVSLELPNFTDNLYNGFVGPTVISATYSPGIMFNGIATSSSFSHGGAITFTGPLSSRMQFGLGVAVRDTKWKQKKEYTHTEKKDTVFVTILDSTLRIDNSSLYMQVPLFINYSLYKTQSSSAYISVGISAVITAKQRSTETVIAGASKRERNRLLGFGDKYSILGVVNLGVGYRHRLNERFNLFGELKYNAAVGKSGLYEVKNSSVTFGVGVSYRFGKKHY